MSSSPLPSEAALWVRHDLRAQVVNIRGFAGEIDTAVAKLLALVERHGNAISDEFRDDALAIFQEDLHPCLEYLNKAAEQLDVRIDGLEHLMAISNQPNDF